MAQRIDLDLIPRDYRRGRPRSTGSCMIAKALERQYGGKWKVSPVSGVTRRSGRGGPKRARLTRSARSVMNEFDIGASVQTMFRGRRTRRITLNGRLPAAAPAPDRRPAPARQPSRQDPARQRQRSLHRGKAVMAGTAAVTTWGLVADGLAWIPLTLLGAVAALFTAFAAIRLRESRPVTRPVLAQVPRQVPQERPQRARSRPVREAAPRQAEPEPGPQPWPAPDPWPGPVPEPVPEPVPWPEPAPPVPVPDSGPGSQPWPQADRSPALVPAREPA